MTELMRRLQRLHLFDVLLVGALTAQIPHASVVFARIAENHEPSMFWEAFLIMHSIAYAIALEGATYYFVKKHERVWAFAFAAFSVLHNVAYYMPPEGFFGIDRYLFSAAIVCIAIPLAIAAFSEEGGSHDVGDHATGVQVERKPQEAPQSARVVDAPQHRLAPAKAQEPAKNAASGAAKRTGMTAEERRRKLAAMRSNGHANTSPTELAGIFEVSPSTISRDLQLIENRKEVA